MNSHLFQERRDVASYYDAIILEIKRRLHDIRGCRCIFLVRYDHDKSEVCMPTFLLLLFLVISLFFHLFGVICFTYLASWMTKNGWYRESQCVNVGILVQEKVPLRRLCLRPKDWQFKVGWGLLQLEKSRQFWALLIRKEMVVHILLTRWVPEMNVEISWLVEF